MTYPTVTNVVTDAAGNPVRGATVIISLVGAPAFSTDVQAEIIDSAPVYTDSTGTWSTTLKPNALITPPNTYYLVQEPGGTSWTIVVPNDTATHTLQSLLVVGPSSPEALLGVVRYDEAQALSSGQKTQAQQNMGVDPASLEALLDPRYLNQDDADLDTDVTELLNNAGSATAIKLASEFAPFSETARAQAAETANATAITNETTRATGVEATKANDAAVVHLAGSETVTGAKAFSTSPTVPTPAALDASSKVAPTAYVDAAVAVEKNRAQTFEATLPATYVGKVSSIQWAAAPTGTDDSANIQAAHDALPADGGIIFLQGGVYKIPTTQVVFSKPTRLVGVGRGTNDSGLGTIIQCSSATLSPLKFTSEGSSISDLAVVNTSGTTPTAGAGILATDFDSGHIDRCRIVGFWNNVEIDAGFFYTISDTDIFAPVNYGAYLKNPSEQDHGDMTLHGVTFSKFSGSTNGGTALQWESGGGLKLIGCKANAGPEPGHAGDGYWDTIVRANIQGTTSVFTVAGCSFEGFTNFGINVTGASTVSFGKIAISGCEFLNSGSGSGAIIQIDGTGMNAGYMNTVSISGCVGYGAGAGISLKYIVAASVTGCTLSTMSGPWLALNHVQKFRHSGNSDNGYVIDNDAQDTSGDAQVAQRGYARDPWVYNAEVYNVAAATTISVIKVAPGVYSAGTLKVRVSGNVATVGGCLLEDVVPVTRGTATSAAVVGSAIGSDISINGTQFTITYDTASQNGYVIIKVAAPSHTFNSGAIRVTYDGPITTWTTVI